MDVVKPPSLEIIYYIILYYIISYYIILYYTILYYYIYILHYTVCLIAKTRHLWLFETTKTYLIVKSHPQLLTSQAEEVDELLAERHLRLDPYHWDGMGKTGDPSREKLGFLSTTHGDVTQPICPTRPTHHNRNTTACPPTATGTNTSSTNPG